MAWLRWRMRRCLNIIYIYINVFKQTVYLPNQWYFFVEDAAWFAKHQLLPSLFPQGISLWTAGKRLPGRESAWVDHVRSIFLQYFYHSGGIYIYICRWILQEYYDNTILLLSIQYPWWNIRYFKGIILPRWAKIDLGESWRVRRDLPNKHDHWDTI